MTTLRLAGAVALAVSLAACGGGSNSSTDTTTTTTSSASSDASAAPKAAPTDAFGKSVTTLLQATDTDFASAKGEKVGDGQWKSKQQVVGSSVCVVQDEKGALSDSCIIKTDLDRATADKTFADNKAKYGQFAGVDNFAENTVDPKDPAVANYILKNDTRGMYLVERKGDNGKFDVMVMFAKPDSLDKNVNT